MSYDVFPSMYEIAVIFIGIVLTLPHKRTRFQVHSYEICRHVEDASRKVVRVNIELCTVLLPSLHYCRYCIVITRAMSVRNSDTYDNVYNALYYALTLYRNLVIARTQGGCFQTSFISHFWWPKVGESAMLVG